MEAHALALDMYLLLPQIPTRLTAIARAAQMEDSLSLHIMLNEKQLAVSGPAKILLQMLSLPQIPSNNLTQYMVSWPEMIR